MELDHRRMGLWPGEPKTKANQTSATTLPVGTKGQAVFSRKKEHHSYVLDRQKASLELKNGVGGKKPPAITSRKRVSGRKVPNKHLSQKQSIKEGMVVLAQIVKKSQYNRGVFAEGNLKTGKRAWTARNGWVITILNGRRN